MSLYPRLMWSPEHVEITVKSAEEQAAKEADGYRLTAAVLEPAAVEPEPTAELVAYVVETDEPPTYGPPDDGTGDEPTEGPADDDTHAKRKKKKA